MCVLVVVDIRVSADVVLKANVQVVPKAAVQHHVSHHPDPVFNLKGDQETSGLLLFEREFLSKRDSMYL